MGYKQEIGRWGEGVAASFLEKKGYTIVDRNYCTPQGEIDLIALMEDDGERVLVFVEVKTRTSERYGYPEDAFTRTKWDHLLRAIDSYFEGQPDLDHPWQIDLIAIQKLGNDLHPDIRHFENIVMGYD